jgi:hypothetical protein
MVSMSSGPGSGMPRGYGLPVARLSAIVDAANGRLTRHGRSTVAPPASRSSS